MSCTKCGKETDITVDGLCTECIPSRSTSFCCPTSYGWICPKCGSVYGPHVNECYKCQPYQYLYSPWVYPSWTTSMTSAISIWTYTQ